MVAVGSGFGLDTALQLAHQTHCERKHGGMGPAGRGYRGRGVCVDLGSCGLKGAPPGRWPWHQVSMKFNKIWVRALGADREGRTRIRPFKPFHLPFAQSCHFYGPFCFYKPHKNPKCTINEPFLREPPVRASRSLIFMVGRKKRVRFREDAEVRLYEPDGASDAPKRSRVAADPMESLERKSTPCSQPHSTSHAPN